MRFQITVACMAALLASGVARAQEIAPAQGVVSAAPTNCPAKKMPFPRFPAIAMRNAESGTVIIRYAIDACGRVLQAEVSKGSGSKALDKAALTGVRTWIVGPPSPEWVSQPTDGWYETPIKFGIGKAP